MNVKSLCLGILSFHEASGYEIKKMVEDGMFSHFIDASFGSIYPALTQMLKQGWVSVRAEEQSGRPDKKVYAITERGRAALREALSVAPQRDKFKSEFLFQMLLMDHVGGDHLASVYDRRLAELRAELERINACAAAADQSPGTRFVNGYGRAIVAAAVTYLEAARDGVLGDARGDVVHPDAAAE